MERAAGDTATNLGVIGIVTSSGQAHCVIYTSQTSGLGRGKATCTVRGKIEELKKFTIVDRDVLPISEENACDALYLVKRIHRIDSDDIYKDIWYTNDHVYDADLKEYTEDMENRPPRRMPHALMGDVNNELVNIKKRGHNWKDRQAETFLQPDDNS